MGNYTPTTLLIITPPSSTPYHGTLEPLDVCGPHSRQQHVVPEIPIGLLVSINPRMSKDFVSILPLNFMYVRYLGFLFKPIQNVHYTGTSLVPSHTYISRRANDCMRQSRNFCLSFYRSVWVSFQAKSNKIWRIGLPELSEMNM
jgi:hypothetical protein